MALEIIAVLHGELFRALTDVVGDAEGLGVAARRARKQGLLSNQVMKKLVRVDDTFAMLRHVSKARALKLQVQVMNALAESCQVQMNHANAEPDTNKSAGDTNAPGVTADNATAEPKAEKGKWHEGEEVQNAEAAERCEDRSRFAALEIKTEQAVVMSLQPSAAAEATPIGSLTTKLEERVGRLATGKGRGQKAATKEAAYLESKATKQQIQQPMSREDSLAAEERALEAEEQELDAREAALRRARKKHLASEVDCG